jgi:guanosine-3',5'-bis(diphosphate) 3'-pyrophosphohydrolase
MILNYGEFESIVVDKLNILLNLLKKHNYSDSDIKLISLAFDVANHAHFEQRRKSGEPYITHPLEVATIVAQWNLDATTIASSLLHDVIEDTQVNREDLEQIFGVEIAELVDSVTKLDKINFKSEEIAHAEYFRKVVLAMSKDIRVILIKLADRMHNMLTLSSMRADKKRKIALETMEIYVPIANKIGLHKIHIQLADAAFKYIYPYRYKVLEKAINISQNNRKPILESILQNIRGGLKSSGIKADFIYKQRGIYNLYRRMLRRHQSFNRIYDIFEVKIIVDTLRDCYLTLGIIHSLYQPLPGKFKDYIAIPKSNGYQSLHSTLMGPKGIPLQIHIRTKVMDDIAENGIISHWLKNKNVTEFISANQRTNNWINNILDIQASSFSAHEFLTSIKQDLSPVDIYVFTPKGRIVILPKNSTTLDFAYHIHSDLGDHFFQAKINNQLSKINTKLQNGDIIEIITDKNIEPTMEWLEYASSGKAISRIKKYLKEQKYEENVSNGQKLINYCLEIIGSDIITNELILKNIASQFYPNFTVEELEHCAGVGSISPLNIAKQILKIDNKYLEIKLSNCININIKQDLSCMALPNENALAILNRHGELVIHKESCKNIKNLALDNLTFVHILNDIDTIFLAKITATIKNMPGTLNKLSGIIAEKNINIIELSQSMTSNDFAEIITIIGVFNLKQLEDLRDSLCENNFVEKLYLE